MRSPLTTSPLNAIIQADVKEAAQEILVKAINPWIFFNSHGIDIPKVNGKRISIKGFEFSGSALDVFWGGFADEWVQKTGRELIELTRRKAIERGLPVAPALTDCLNEIRLMVATIFNRMAEIEQRLKGKGYPKSVPKTDVSHLIQINVDDLEKIVEAEFMASLSRQPKQSMSLPQAYYEKEFENRFLRSKGNEFQILFEQLMKLAYPADFMACRPWGTQGDRKNDGFLKSERRLFQIYAPYEMKSSEAIAKITEDFEGAKQYWREYFDTWVFGHNAVHGLPPHVHELILNFEKKNPGIKLEPWGWEEFRLIFRKLTQEDLQSWLGGIPETTPHTAISPFLKLASEPRRGIKFAFVLFLKNTGSKTVKNIRLRLEHSETHTVAWAPSDDWKHLEKGISLPINPWDLEYTKGLNPQEETQVIAIPFQEIPTEQIFISLHFSAEDTMPQDWIFKTSPDNLENNSYNSFNFILKSKL